MSTSITFSLSLSIYIYNVILSGEGNFPLLLLVLLAGLIMKWTQTKKQQKSTHSINTYRGLICTKPKKYPEQAVYIYIYIYLLHKETIHFRSIDKVKRLMLGY